MLPQIQIFDKSRKILCDIGTAYNITELKTINNIWNFSFTLPDDDYNNKYCQAFNLVKRYETGQLYRIMANTGTETELGDIEYRCEHVLAMLLNDPLEGWQTIGGRGYYTRQVIEWVLSHQLTKNWVLHECDFNRQFEYDWQNEPLLKPIFDIPKSFIEPYMWVTDTSVYPWRLSLKRLDVNQKPQFYIDAKKNMLKLASTSESQNLCTRLIALGAGEGVYQVNIKEFTRGLSYVQSPPEIIAKYGIVTGYFFDERYTNAESLYNTALSILADVQEPYKEYLVDYAMLDEEDFYKADVGKIVMIDGKEKVKSYVTQVTFNYDDITKSTIQIANKPKNIADTIAQMADRLRINSAYSQGATQIYGDSVQENGDAQNGAIIDIEIDEDLLEIKEVSLRVRMSPARSYTKVTGGAGGGTIGISTETTSGASTKETTASGGGQTSGSSSSNTTENNQAQTSEASSQLTTENNEVQSTTTEAGGGSSNTETGYEITDYSQIAQLGFVKEVENHNHGVTTSNYYEKFVTDVNFFNQSTSKRSFYFEPSGAHTHKLFLHAHKIDIPSHYHEYLISAHKHNMNHTHNISSHTHPMAHTHNISNHVHSMQHIHNIYHTHVIGDHVHTLTFGITFSDNPSSFTLYIDDVKRATYNTLQTKIDITDILAGPGKKIQRGKDYKIEIRPNTGAYIRVKYTVKGYIQSRGSKTV